MDAQTPGHDAPGVDPVARETGAMEILTEEECWSLFASVEVGRLAVAAAGDIDIFPLNFAVHDRTILFRTAEGTKLVEVVLAGRVAFEIDGYEPEHGRAWSVVCKGQAQMLDKWDDIYAAQDMPLFPWNHSPKERFVRIAPYTVSGRRFTVYSTRDGSEPHL